MAKAIALLSGGLDSTLAVLLMRRQGIDVTAVTFLTHFGCDAGDSSSCSADSSSNARKFGFEVKLCHLADRFIEIVKNPKFGRGRNMNPCIDCRILMLREAAELMRLSGADFIMTGEVLGQRPMSQRRDVMSLIDREAAVEGYVLRPLSARLFKPTVPELKGIVDREKLLDFNGRSRRPQLALAEEFGLTDYLPAAGGCLLTDPIYSYKLKELLSSSPDPPVRDFHLLRVGRHFRLPGGLKIIVGRNKEENERLTALADGDYMLKVEGSGSPTALINRNASEHDIRTAASLCARYSDAKRLAEVEVAVYSASEPDMRPFVITARPADDGMIESLRVQRRAEAKVHP